MVSIARLGPEDIALYRGMNALFAQVFAMPADYLADAPDDEWCRDWLAERRNIAVVALHDGAVVGALAGYVLDKFEQARRECFIYDLAVSEDFRRQGIATSLIEEVRRIARECGAWTIFVQADVFPEDEPARALYRKLAHEEITAHHFDIAP